MAQKRYKTFFRVRELERENREKDAQLAELTDVLNRTTAVVNSLPSITGLSPVRDYSGIPLAISDLQASYKDAARARNGMYTKLDAKIAELTVLNGKQLLLNQKAIDKIAELEALRNKSLTFDRITYLLNEWGQYQARNMFLKLEASLKTQEKP